MSGSLEAVVFDLDGTLHDSLPAIVACFRASFESQGLGAPTADEICALVGLPLTQIVSELLPNGDANALHAVEATYREGYAEFDRSHSRWFPGALELVRVLRAKGVKTAIATGKGSNGLRRVLREAGIADLFDVALGRDAVPRGKPHPDQLLEVMRLLGVVPAHTVMIGDTTYDIEMAVRAEVPAIGVEWGAHDAEQLRVAGAKHVVGVTRELRDLLAGRAR